MKCQRCGDDCTRVTYDVMPPAFDPWECQSCGWKEEPASAKARNDVLEEAMAAIQREREKAASDFTSERCRGQRGQDRTDALYDAYEVVRKLKT